MLVSTNTDDASPILSHAIDVNHAREGRVLDRDDTLDGIFRAVIGSMLNYFLNVLSSPVLYRIRI